MSPVQAVQSCFINYFNFSGRAPRSEYWWFSLFLNILYGLYVFVSYIIDSGYGDALQPGDNASYVSVLTVALVFLFIPFLAVSVRRLHDIDKSGWWILMLFFLPFIGTILCIYWFIREGDPGSNQFGESPVEYSPF